MTWKNPCTTDWENQCTKKSLNQWISELVSRWANEPVNQWINESVNQWTDDSVNWWSSDSMNRWINKSMSESVSRWTNESVSQGLSASNESMNQWSNESMRHWIHESMDQWPWMNELVSLLSQWIRQSMNESVTVSESMNQWFNDSMSKQMKMDGWMDGWMDAWMDEWATSLLSYFFTERPSSLSSHFSGLLLLALLYAQLCQCVLSQPITNPHSDAPNRNRALATLWCTFCGKSFLHSYVTNDQRVSSIFHFPTHFFIYIYYIYIYIQFYFIPYIVNIFPILLHDIYFPQWPERMILYGNSGEAMMFMTLFTALAAVFMYYLQPLFFPGEPTRDFKVSRGSFQNHCWLMISLWLVLSSIFGIAIIHEIQVSFFLLANGEFKQFYAFNSV